jgi:hypothetical protein
MTTHTRIGRRKYEKVHTAPQKPRKKNKLKIKKTRFSFLLLENFTIRFFFNRPFRLSTTTTRIKFKWPMKQKGTSTLGGVPKFFLLQRNPSKRRRKEKKKKKKK